MKSSKWIAGAILLTLSLPCSLNAQQKPVTIPGHAPPFAGKPMTSEEALKQVTKLAPEYKPLEQAMNEAKAKYKKHPKDAKLKTAYVDATYKYGHTVMQAGQKQPRVMYRASLALYRRALAVDPKHKPSLEDKKTIEDIYKSMGMPIPK